MSPTLPPAELHLPFEAGPFRMALGLGSVPERAWIEIDDQVPAQLAERAALIANRRDATVAATAGSEAMQRELLDMLVQHLRTYHAGMNQPPAEPGEEPLVRIGHLAAEDFCLLRDGEAGPVLAAAVLCFPARWRLAEKIGRPLVSVHAPVPFYRERLSGPVDRFLSMLRPGRIAARRNWSIVDDAALFQPDAPACDRTTDAITAENAASRLFLRVERQTFRRLPVSGAIAFGIRTHVTPLAAVVRQPGAVSRLRDALQALPAEMQRYKSLPPFGDAVLACLDALDPAPEAGEQVPCFEGSPC